MTQFDFDKKRIHAYMKDKSKLIQDYIEEVWNQKNIDACPSYIGRTYAIRNDPGDPWEGKTLDIQAFTDRVSHHLNAFPDQRYKIEELVRQGDSVVCSWRWKGTHLGQIAQYAPTFQTLTMSGITIFYTFHLSLSGHWQVTDRMSLFQQLQNHPAPTK